MKGFHFRRETWRFMAFFAATCVLVLSLAPLPETPTTSPQHLDKFVHFTMYASLMWLFSRAYKTQPASTLALYLLCYGALLEGLQQWLGWRTGSLEDCLANAIGIAFIAVPIWRSRTSEAL